VVQVQNAVTHPIRTGGKSSPTSTAVDTRERGKPPCARATRTRTEGIRADPFAQGWKASKTPNPERPIGLGRGTPRPREVVHDQDFPVTTDDQVNPIPDSPPCIAAPRAPSCARQGRHAPAQPPAQLREMFSPLCLGGLGRRSVDERGAKLSTRSLTRRRSCTLRPLAPDGLHLRISCG
jgi:hypothetical protein